MRATAARSRAWPSGPHPWCGNDGLQARSNFAGQSGTCNYGPFNTAQSNCTTYLQAAIQYISANASANTKQKVVSNLYYPGYAADNALSGCNDPHWTEGEQADHLPAVHGPHELARV